MIDEKPKQAKPKQVWIDKFHPNNGRLKFARLKLMSDSELQGWIALGMRDIKRYEEKDETFNVWRGGMEPASMLEWCQKRVELIKKVQAQLRKPK